MKSHASQDMLLKLALGVLSPAAERRVLRHVELCTRCREQLGEMKASVRLLGDVKPKVSAHPPARPSRRHVKTGGGWLTHLGEKGRNVLRGKRSVVPDAKGRVFLESDRPAIPGGKRHTRERVLPLKGGWIRLAAVLALGFGLGYLVSESVRPVHVTVIRQQFVPRTPDQAAGTFVVSREVDLSVLL